MSEASDRASHAWEKCYDHRRAARDWAAIAREQPHRREICEILARYMSAYQAADAEAEKAFLELAAREENRGAAQEP